MQILMNHGHAGSVCPRSLFQNRLLRAGWNLFVADRREGEHQWLHYQLALQREDDPMEITFTGIEPGPNAF
jgi:hypothetical protein